VTTTTYLLDANVLIALTVAEHEHHDRASAWAATTDRFALCPIVEGALVRFLVRIGESTHAAAQVLRALHAMPRCEFWPDSLPYTDTPLDHVQGHRQVTDAYLAGLTAAHPHAQLATFDTALAQQLPTHCHLVP
jgi:toxin-antitoxin system PIN domain toxin